MGAYILRRILLMVPTLLGVTMLVFFIMAAAPGDPIQMLMSKEGEMTAGDRAAMMKYYRQRYGVHRPAIVQYGRWLNKISPVGFMTSDQTEVDPNELDMARQQLDTSGLFDNPRDLEGAVGVTVMLAQYRQSGPVPVARELVESMSNAPIDAARFLWEVGHRRVELDGDPPEGADDETLRLRKALLKVRGQIDAGRAAMLELLDDEMAGMNRVVFTKPTIKWPDLGESRIYNRPVDALIAEALPVTLLLNLLSLPLVYAIAILAGIYAARHQGKLIDIGSGVAMLGLWSVPTIWAGVLLVGYLANRQYVQWFPTNGLHDLNAAEMTFLPTGGFVFAAMVNVAVLALAAVAAGYIVMRVYRYATDVEPRPHDVAMAILAGVVSLFAFSFFLTGRLPALPGEERGWLFDLLWHLALPVICLSYGGFAFLAKLSRGTVLENIRADFVRTARAKGVNESDVLWHHVFRNSLLPLITVAAFVLPALLSGSIIVEVIFSINGMGKLVILAIDFKDQEVVMAVTLITGFLSLVAYLIADVMYAVADPRVSYE